MTCLFKQIYIRDSHILEIQKGHYSRVRAIEACIIYSYTFLPLVQEGIKIANTKIFTTHIIYQKAKSAFSEKQNKTKQK